LPDLPPAWRASGSRSTSTRCAADPRLTGARLDLAHPGERCRIGRVFDVIAPRARLDREDFPGVPGSVAKVGDGRTVALSGVAVVVTDQVSQSTKSRIGQGMQDVDDPDNVQGFAEPARRRRLRVQLEPLRPMLCPERINRIPGHRRGDGTSGISRPSGQRKQSSPSASRST
jgi:hypothetical protein